MMEKLFREILKEAREEEQIGLMIWANPEVWKSFGPKIWPDTKIYDFILSQITKQPKVTMSIEGIGLSMPVYMAVSVQKLSTSNKFFYEVLNICEKGNCKGPVMLIPSNKMIEI